MKLALIVAVVVTVSANNFPNNCGKRNSPSTSLDGAGSINYIVGGSNAIRNEFPWQISFQVRRWYWFILKRYRHICGGSIINDQWILTAAHCHIKGGVKKYRIVTGAHKYKGRETTKQKFLVENIIVHPEWNKTTIENDIALIKIAGRFKLDGRTTAPICLPESSADVSYNVSEPVCTTSGWGRTREEGHKSRTLRHVDLPIVPNTKCIEIYRNMAGTNVSEKNICAGHLDCGGTGACEGDSGGPLACLRNGRYTLAGITSFGVICGSAEFPTVYTRVAAYKDWIDYTMANN